MRILQDGEKVWPSRLKGKVCMLPPYGGGGTILSHSGNIIRYARILLDSVIYNAERGGHQMSDIQALDQEWENTTKTSAKPVGSLVEANSAKHPGLRPCPDWGR